MYEVRIHGRGGQGAVMAAQALADAAFIEGNYAVAFPFFGAERRGAPVLAFTRVDRNRIRFKTQVYEPDYVVVLDDTLLRTVNVVQGLKPNGIVIVNTTDEPKNLHLGAKVSVAVVDATSIALKVLGVAATNSTMLGAFAKATGVVRLESVLQGIRETFSPRIGEKAAAKNADCAAIAYEQTVVGMSGEPKEFVTRKQWLPTYKELPIGGASRTRMTDSGLVGMGSFIENKTGDWRTFMPKLDETKCTQCLFCWFYCPEGCIARTETAVKIDYDYCKGCGICAKECPKNAITMMR